MIMIMIILIYRQTDRQTHEYITSLAEVIILLFNSNLQ